MAARARSYRSAVTFALTGVIIGLGIISAFYTEKEAYAEEPKISRESIDILTRMNQALSEVAGAVKPAVVNISSTRTIRTPGIPFFDDPFFRRFFGDEFGELGRPREHKQASLGSGVIVDKSGYILTNNHVIRDADDIRIRLSDKREFKGKVVGTDPKTDLAVIRITANNLPVLRLGDSDRLKVGERVIAIGNPFGLNQTVTSGIVSATGRADVGIADFEDFIQTDAPINPGNSGGALVNVRGELVGVNTAIFSTSGGYQGIGFAIPSNMAKAVMDSLIKNGKVVRGWLGVVTQAVTPDIAKQFGLKDERGALVADVSANGPAQKAGIARGDVIIAFDGKEVSDALGLRNTIANTSPGKEVPIRFIRDGKPHTARVTIKELPAEVQARPGAPVNSLKGVTVQNLSPDLRKNLNIPKQVTGVVVTGVEDGSPAEATLQKGDVIMEINKVAIRNTKEYEAIVSRIKARQNVTVLVHRNGKSLYVNMPGR